MERHPIGNGNNVSANKFVRPPTNENREVSPAQSIISVSSSSPPPRAVPPRLQPSTHTFRPTNATHTVNSSKFNKGRRLQDMTQYESESDSLGSTPSDRNIGRSYKDLPRIPKKQSPPTSLDQDAQYIPKPLQDRHQPLPSSVSYDPRANMQRVQGRSDALGASQSLPQIPGLPPTGIARNMPNIGPSRPVVTHHRPQPPQPPYASAGNPIRIPSNPLPGSRSNLYQVSASASRPVTFDEFDDDGPEPYSSPADVQRALQDLIQASIGEASIEGVDMEKDTKVDGFRSEITLKGYQAQGRKWMRDREEGKGKRGGILADDMGLGKTIQTLARIVDGKITDDDRKAGCCRATLIVCPVGLMKQWQGEIKKMCIGITVVEHHGPNRTADFKKLQNADVVITSFPVVQSEYASFLGPEAAAPKKKGKGKKASNGSDSETDRGSESDDAGFTKKALPSAKKAKRTACPLFEGKWLRIVLDEAQNIKNKAAKTSIACCELDGRYRWCLTGTPIQNNIEELFPLFKFLGIKPFNEWAEFKRIIADPVKAGRTARAMKRLHVVLKAIMLRRTKDQTINGVKLVNLPARNVNIVQCVFDEDEHEFYRALQERTTVAFNKFLREGEVMRNYTSVLLLLLRMRQACDHPGLIQKDFGQDVDAIEPEAPRNVRDEEAVAQQEEDELAELLSKMGVKDEAPKCTICLDILQPGQNAFCSKCNNTGIAATSRRKSLAAHNTIIELDSDSDSPAVTVPKKSIKPKVHDLPPDSAKIRKIVELLGDIHRRSDGEEKTIIFSQFTGMLDLIEPFLKAEAIRFVRLDGSMPPQQREDALNKIKNNNLVPVILISFKAGGTGLNLTCCNNVILVDLWWNPALEDQAFDRAHRVGQTRDVHIYKLVVENTVEDRILTLQDSKRQLANAALTGDKLSTNRNKLNMQDLMKLFESGGKEDEDEEDD